MSDRKDFHTNFEEASKMYATLRDNGKSHNEAVKILQTKYTGLGPGNQERLEKGYKPPAPKSPAPKPPVSQPPAPKPPAPKPSVSQPPAPKPPAPKPPAPKPPSGNDVISTLDLNLLTKGGGSWNISRYNLKKSVVTTFKGETVIKCQYDKNSGTSNDPGVGGCSFTATPTGMNKDAIVFSWDVYYPKGFQFAKGGKYGGVLVGYGEASGYKHSETGASNRIMWQQDGGIIDYIYPADNLKQKIPGIVAEGHGCGFFNDDFQKALKFDSWNRLELGTKMNTFKNGVPQLDGESSVTVNGKKQVLKGINWSRNSDLKISQFDLGTFFGGPLPSPVSQFCYFKNFQMRKY